MKIKFTKKVRKKLRSLGFITKLDGWHYIHAGVRFELPCDMSDAEFSGNPIEIGRFSYVGEGFKYDSPLKIGRFCSIARDVSIGVHNHPVDTFSSSPVFYADYLFGKKNKYKEFDFEASKPVEISSHVWIGQGVVIKGGIKIGSGSIVGCSAVVTSDIEKDMICVGIPARIMRRVSREEADEKRFLFAENGKVLTYKDFAQFLPLKVKIRNFLRKVFK
jgi:acetyltransferase-like isoleucine patch superfamily enzyme